MKVTGTITIIQDPHGSDEKGTLDIFRRALEFFNLPKGVFIFESPRLHANIYFSVNKFRSVNKIYQRFLKLESLDFLLYLNCSVCNVGVQ